MSVERKQGGHFCRASEGLPPKPGDVVWRVELSQAPWRDPRYVYGSAVGACAEYDDGTFWVDNGEYGSPVNFCPYCGTAAPTPVLKRKT